MRGKRTLAIALAAAMITTNVATVMATTNTTVTSSTEINIDDATVKFMVMGEEAPVYVVADEMELVAEESGKTDEEYKGLVVIETIQAELDGKMETFLTLNLKQPRDGEVSITVKDYTHHGDNI